MGSTQFMKLLTALRNAGRINVAGVITSERATGRTVQAFASRARWRAWAIRSAELSGCAIEIVIRSTHFTLVK